ncbi:MAG: hypothetical protein E7673_01645 [Ruminococcaceae bacterium]|nr:hypothetical protein [Oscillospiraceae bacterium]
MKKHGFIKYLLTATSLVCALTLLASCKDKNKNNDDDNNTNQGAHEHSFGEWTTVTEPECETEGKKTRKCGGCGVTEEAVIQALGHDEISHEAKDPNCTETGYDAYVTCSRCDYTTFEELPIRHNYEEGVCTVCGTACENHTFDEWHGNTATCQAAGEEHRECSNCGIVETRPTEKFTSHKYENKVCIWCGKKDYTLPPQPLGEN